MKKIIVGIICLIFCTTSVGSAAGLSTNTTIPVPQNLEINVKTISVSPAQNNVNNKTKEQDKKELDEKTTKALEKVKKFDNNSYWKYAENNIKISPRHIPTEKSLSKKKYIKINLQDGDYVYWQPGKDNATEYHANGELMGFIDIKIFENYSAALYEYRISKSGELNAKLKHIMILYPDQNASFIYAADKKLRCFSIDKEVYMLDNLEMPTAVAEIPQLNMFDTIGIVADQFTNLFWYDSSDSETGLPPAFDMCLYSCYGGPLVFVVTPLMLTGFVFTSLIMKPALKMGTRKSYQKLRQEMILKGLSNYN